MSGRGEDTRPGRWQIPTESTLYPSTTIFLILRRMRAPLIILIVIFAFSVLGLTLIPGRDGSGRPWRMGFFDAFYFMSYTATTIGFGEIPHAFTPAQRLWVTVTIYLTVIGWRTPSVRCSRCCRTGRSGRPWRCSGSPVRCPGCASRSC